MRRWPITRPLCHLGNISYRLGQSTSFQEKPGLLGDNAEVLASFAALRENLQAVNVQLGRARTYQLGRVLTLDPQTEKFANDEEANKLLTRPYLRSVHCAGCRVTAPACRPASKGPTRAPTVRHSDFGMHSCSRHSCSPRSLPLGLA